MTNNDKRTLSRNKKKINQNKLIYLMKSVLRERLILLFILT